MIRARALLVLVLGLSAAGPPAVQDPPKMFDLQQTGIDREAAKKLASQLVAYAQTQTVESSEYYLVGHYRKLVRLAFQLAPDEPAVVAAHGRIRSGHPPESPKSKVEKEIVMPSLVSLLAKAREGITKDDENLASYLCATGLLIDSANQACISEYEKLVRNPETLWDPALAAYKRTVADGTVTTIKGLVVSTSGMAMAGQTARIVLTYRAKSFPGLEVRLLRERGAQMNVAADEAVRYWNRVSKTVPMPSGNVEISFEDKFTPKEGPSAGAACAVLLRSFSDPFPIDSAVAMTGDVSVEGRVLQVGGTYAKIRGALLGGCNRVGIPTANEGDLVDSVVLNGTAVLTDIEIVGLDTIDDAISLVRSDRDEKALKVSADFASLRKLVDQKSKGGADAAVSASIQKLTDAILAANPRHLSARLIDLWNNNKQPARLSLTNSLDAAHDVLVGYLLTIQRSPRPSLGDVAYETTTANIAAALDRLRLVLPKLHADAQKPSEKLEQCCVSIQRFIYLRGDVEKKQKKVEEFDKSIKDFDRKIERAKAEKRPVEEINTLIKRRNQVVTDQAEAFDAYKKETEERANVMKKAIDHYNDFVIQVRTLTQDPRILEKLQQGK